MEKHNFDFWYNTEGTTEKVYKYQTSALKQEVTLSTNNVSFCPQINVIFTYSYF